MTDITLPSSAARRPQGDQDHPHGLTGRRGGVFRGVLLALLVLLVPQFVLGMVINLDVPFPGTLHGVRAWHWALAQPVIALHISLGTLLVLLAVVAVGLGSATRRLAPLLWSGLGCVLLLLTWVSGDFFLVEGQQNMRSLTMALGFLGR